MSQPVRIPFFEVFSAYIPKEEALCIALASCLVTHMKPDPATATIQATLLPEVAITRQQLEQLEGELAVAYGVKRVELTLPPEENTPSVEENTQEVPDYLSAVQTAVVGCFLPAKGLLAGATGVLAGQRFTISLPNGGSSLLSGYTHVATQVIQQTFGLSLQVIFQDEPLEKAQDDVAFLQAAEGERQAAMKSIKPAPKKIIGAAGSTMFGKVSQKHVTPMKDINLDMGMVLVEGDVFAVDHKDLRNRTDKVVRFDITDYTSSIRVTQFMTEQESRSIVQNLKVGQHLLVQGRLVIDRFENDMVLQPVGIVYGEKEERIDTAPHKRVELHLHTCMSAVDALVKTEAAVVRAAQWGHRAIAITDHGVAHAFPDADHAAHSKDGKNIKVLYGVEAYMQNDVDDTVAVHGPSDLPLMGEYVVFDIETTGFDPKREAIIEIGGVRIKDGQIQPQRFSTFANPKRPLSPKIISLTGITDDMLVDAPEQDAAVSAFLQFVGSRPLVAHNADFDVSFIRQAAQRMGVAFQPTTVDTLALARRLYPNLNNHKLDTVASHVGLEHFQHHRADDDAAAAGGIFLHQMQLLAERGVNTLAEIDTALAGDRVGGKTRRSAYHLIVLAKNQVGLRNLYKLISLSHLDHFHRTPVMPKSLITENREGLIIGSACEAGEVFQAILAGKGDEEQERIGRWYDFLEIQPLSNNGFMLRPTKDGRVMARDMDDLRDFNRRVVDLGARLQKPVCATGDVHFLDPHEEIYRHILLDSKKFDDADSSNPLYFRTTDEMLEEFSYLGAEMAYQVVVTNTNLVADWCDQVSPLPKGLFTPKIENSAGQLTDLVWGKVKSLYGDNPPALVIDRINVELGDIIDCKYDVIYMSAQKLVQDSLEHGYLVGSRGSVGSSIVAFLSGITEVNSLPPHYRCPSCKHADFEAGINYGCGADMPDTPCPVCGTPYEKDGFNIPFETFLGFGGGKVPDIDLNFSGEYQGSAHKYTFELFGNTHVFRSGTIGTIAVKTAFGYVKKYLEKRLLTATRAEENRLALGCTGVKRTTGQHPGGMVVIPQDKEIYDFCPVQHPADDRESDIITTHFEYHAMESNLLKLDMLGHDDPSMIRMLQDLTGVDPQSIHLDDRDTMSIFTSSTVLGFTGDKVLGPTGACAIPEFGTSFVRGMLEDTQPSEFDVLVRISGFSHGTDVWLGNAKDLITSGTATVGQAIGCRDDIMLYLIQKGMEPKRAFKVMEFVRKGRGLPPGSEDEMREHGVPDWYIGSCKKIAYLFPKAHAVAYVMMAFRIAWFKVHRPLAFYAAYFTIRAKAFDATVMCQGMDIVKGKMQAIINKDKEASAVEQDMLVTLEVCYEFYLRGFSFEAIDLYRSDAVRFLVDESKKTLLPPFTSVPGLGEAAAQSIIEQRVGRTFISVAELSAVCPKVSKAHIEGLKATGSLAGMPESSQLTLFG